MSRFKTKPSGAARTRNKSRERKAFSAWRRHFVSQSEGRTALRAAQVRWLRHRALTLFQRVGALPLSQDTVGELNRSFESSKTRSAS